jgi:GTP-binding protein
MQIHKAEFVTSAGKPGEYPAGDLPEFAFCGRSNVGKSSLMNSMLGRRNLVKTSKTPGRTRRLNFFDADGRLRFVDLPGYGYAQVSPAERQSWKPMVETYLRHRPQLKLCVLLVDARREAMKSDLEMQAFLEQTGLRYEIVATKADKLGRNALQSSVAELRRAFGRGVLPYSAETGLGREELWARILEHIEARPRSPVRATRAAVQHAERGRDQGRQGPAPGARKRSRGRPES